MNITQTLGNNLRINDDRLWNSLMEMAKIGPGIRGGNNRQALTDEDAAGRRLFQLWCKDAGASMHIDTMGNMFARIEGTDPSLAPVMVGSHLDTQPTGGKYDGVLGVLAGLEVLRTIKDLGLQTRHPIEVVNWTNEEGTRFPPAMVSSGVFTGIHDQDWAYERTDTEGKKFGDELKRIGFCGEEPIGQRKLHAFFELHIEQGPILEDEGIDIGVVTHGQGLTWLEVTLTGKEAHTGSTPMAKRINAGLGAARIIELTHKIALENAPHGLGAVGKLDFSPNSRNIVPGKAVFTVDFRHPDKMILDKMESELRDGAQQIAKDLGLGLDVERIGHFDPVAFDETCLATIRRASKELGFSQRDIIAGAGHDACWISHVAPTAMIFCPCVDGLSHNEDEEISKEWASAGANVLLRAVLETAELG